MLVCGSDDVPVDLVNEILAKPQMTISADISRSSSSSSCASAARRVAGNDAHGGGVGRGGAEMLRQQSAFVGNLLNGAFPIQLLTSRAVATWGGGRCDVGGEWG